MPRAAIRHLFIWSAAVVLSVFAGMTAIASVAKLKRPELALAMWPDNGFALAEKADEAFKQKMTSSEGYFPKKMPREAVTLARQALAVEPSSVVAVRTLGYHHYLQGREAEARRLIQRAFALSKRDVLTNFWLIEDYSQSGDADGALRMYDATLRTTGEGRGILLTAMAGALSNEELIEPFHRLLGSSPPWAESFWRQVAQTPASVPQAATLRLRLGKNIKLPRENEELLLNALIDQQRFEFAFRLHKEIASRPVGQSTNLLINGDFSDVPGLRPFDWRLISSGEMGAGIDTRSGLLEMSALGGAKGVIAEQLVALSPGRYRLEGDIRQREGVPAAPITAELACAAPSADGAASFQARLHATKDGHVFDLTRSGCDFYWLRLAIDASELHAGSELALDHLRLSKV